MNSKSNQGTAASVKALIAVMGALVLGFSCTENQTAVKKTDTSADCRGICARYTTCVDATYDTRSCERQCQNTASVDLNFRQKADTCNECITNKACAQQSAACGAECSSVLVVSPRQSSR